MNDYHVLCFVFLLISGSLGVLFNFTFFITSIRRQELNKVYSFFLLSTSFMNFLYSANNAVLQPYILYVNIQPNTAYCSIVAVAVSFSGMGGVCSRMYVALSRFITLYYPARIPMFSRRNNFLMITFTWIACLLLAMVLFFFGDMARLADTVCGPNIETMPFLRTFFFMIPFSVAYGICIYSAYKIWRLLKKHQKNSQVLGIRFKDAKEVFRLIIIELLVPVCLELPLLFFSFFSNYIILPKLLLSAFVCLFIMYPTVEPVVVVLIMKPYKLAFLKEWYSLRGINAVHPIHTTTTSTTRTLTH